MTPIIVYFNICWMKEYRGITDSDKPQRGGKFIPEHGYGSEIYNFQPFEDRLYGFVEPGYKPQPRCIDIKKLGASKTASSVSGILVVWVARDPMRPRTVVVGWYKDATVYRERRAARIGSTRMLPSGTQAKYFVLAEEQNCELVPAHKRNHEIPRGGKGELGETNIWYAKGEVGSKVKASTYAYISNYRVNP